MPEFDYEASLSACAKGERQALRALYQQEASRLLTVVQRILQNRSVSEEIVHDAFVKIWANAHRYRPELGAARGWIYTLTRNLALNALEKNRRNIQADPTFVNDLLDDLQQQSGSQTSEQESKLEENALHHCIEKLSDMGKQCIVYAYINGYSQTEIATLIDSPLGSVKSWIRRSLLSLKECLQ